MNKVVQKPVDNYMENLLKSVWGKIVGKIGNSSFPYKSTKISYKSHINSTTISTRIINNFPLLKLSFSQFPHSLLLLLLNN